MLVESQHSDCATDFSIQKAAGWSFGSANKKNQRDRGLFSLAAFLFVTDSCGKGGNYADIKNTERTD